MAQPTGIWVASDPGEKAITLATAAWTIQGVCEPLEQF